MDSKIYLHWEQLIGGSGRSVRDVSRSIGLNPTYLGQQISKARNGLPTSTPSVTAVMALAAEFHCSVEEIMDATTVIDALPMAHAPTELESQGAKVIGQMMRAVNRRMAIGRYKPSVEDILTWWRANDGKLIGTDQIQDACALVEVPTKDCNTITPHSIGRKSLASEVMGGHSIERLTSVIRDMPVGDQKKLAQYYRQAAISKIPVISGPLEINIDFPEDGIHKQVSYIRLLLPIEAPNGSPFLLSYCFRI